MLPLSFYAVDPDGVRSPCKNPPHKPEQKDRNGSVKVTSITEGVIRRMTMKNPKNRYSSWNEILFQLKKANSRLEEKDQQSS